MDTEAKRQRQQRQQRVDHWKENNTARLLWSNARYRTKKSGTPFTIRVVDVIVPKKCPYLDIPLNNKRGRGYKLSDCPQLDRYDSTLGYTEHNIQVISALANRMKNDATPEQLDTFAKNQLLKFASARTRKEVYEQLKSEFEL